MKYHIGSFEGLIARKHLTRRKRAGFISLITMISVGGVAIGVMALIVVLGVMSGFDREFKSKIVNVQPHLRIEKVGGVDRPDEVMQQIKGYPISDLMSMSKFVEGQAMIRSETNATGIIVKGIDQAEDHSVYQDHLVLGQFNIKDDTIETQKRRLFLFKTKREEDIGRIVIGEHLAAKLNVSIGDRVSLITPFRSASSSFKLTQVESAPFVVSGIFRIGRYDFDSALVIISLNRAQRMYHLGQNVTGISLRFGNVDDAEKWKFMFLRDLPPDYYVRTWYDMNQTFFQALKVEKSMLTILLALIILVAAFNIVSTLTMIVMEKTRDIGILRAIGATAGSIRKIFIFEGVSVGFWGILLGVASGLALALNLNAVADFIKRTTGFEIFPSDIYYFDHIPVLVHPTDVIGIVGFAFLITLLSGVYPAHRAAQLNPIEALRHE